MAITPGPWHIGNGADCAKDHAVCAGAMVVARATGYGYPISKGGTGWHPESAANAVAMAATPELIAVLRELTDWMRDNTGPSDGTLDMLTRAMELLGRVGG